MTDWRNETRVLLSLLSCMKRVTVADAVAAAAAGDADVGL